MAEKIDVDRHDEIFAGFVIWRGRHEDDSFTASQASPMKKIHQQFEPMCKKILLTEGKLLNNALSEEEI